MARKRRICIIGLDCLAPELVFGDRLRELPSFAALVQEGLAGPIESTVPPITVPAWSCMLTGCDPGVLGCYGFHDRLDHGYTERRLASSLDIREPTLWTHIGRARGISRLITVPQTYPPKPLHGVMVSDYPAGETAHAKTYPDYLAQELQGLLGGELCESTAHRQRASDTVIAATLAATQRRFQLARTWARESDWTLLMLVDMGPDRMHHAFWADQRGVASANGDARYADAISDYYRMLDREVGHLVEGLASDDLVLVVSDHGARTMKGGIAINQWLADAGYLHLRSRPTAPTPFAQLDVDFGKTRAWADGGYVGRVYFNIHGREPLGMVPQAAVTELAAEIKLGLGRVTGLDGERLETLVYAPHEVYRQVRGVAPDLIVYFDDLAYRALGSVGHPTVCVTDNDSGRDHANHARHGVFILRDGRGQRLCPASTSLYDVLPTILDRLELSTTTTLRGRALY